MPQNTYTFDISMEEQNLLINHCVSLPPEIGRKLRFGLLKGKRLSFTFSAEEFEGLLYSVGLACEQTADRKTTRKFERLFEHLRSNYDAPLELNEMHEMVESLPDTVKAEILNILQANPDAAFEEVEEELTAVIEKHLEADMPGYLDGAFELDLEPDMLGQLLFEPLGHPDNAVKMKKDFSHKAVMQSDLFRNVCMMLTGFIEEGKIKATKRGNLSRKGVQYFLDCLEFYPGYPEYLQECHKQLNEADVTKIEMCRILLECTGCIAVKKDYFVPTKHGREMVLEKNAGQFYHELFTAFFIDIDIAYFDQSFDWPELQAGFAYILWALSELENYETMEDLYELLLIPPITLPVAEIDEQLKDFTFQSRIINPLNAFGLLDTKEIQPYKNIPLKAVTKARPSKLFEQFISFKFK